MEPFAKFDALALSTNISVGGKVEDVGKAVRHASNMITVCPQEMSALSSASKVLRTTVLIVKVRQETGVVPRNSR